MKRLILFTAILLGCLVANAQVPGYMGKKHLFLYSPSLSIFGNEYRVDNTKGIGHFYLSHHFEYNYVIKKDKTIGLFYEYAGEKINTTPYSYYTLLTESVPMIAKYRKHQIGFNFRKYFRRHGATLAPLGTYMKYSLSYINSKSVMTEESAADYNQYFLNDYGAISMESSYWDLAFGIGMGKQFIVAKWIPINVELSLNLPMRSAFDLEYSATGIEKANGYTTLANSFLKFNVGIGLLAF